MTIVKLCGMTSQDAVRAAVQAGADAIGFVFAESVRRVTPAQAVELARDVPANVRRVAVMLHPANDEWCAVREIFRPDVLQTDAGDLASLELDATTEVWPVYRQGVSEPPEDFDGIFVYEGAASGAGSTVDWRAAARRASPGRMVLAGGLSADNVAQAIAVVRPFGVDTSSALESAPGQKDAKKIHAFVNKVREADQETAT